MKSLREIDALTDSEILNILNRILRDLEYHEYSFDKIDIDAEWLLLREENEALFTQSARRKWQKIR